MRKRFTNLRKTPEYLEFGYHIVPCPVCGNETLDEFWICEFCNWEYDGITDENEYSPCNSGTLAEYKAQYKEDCYRQKLETLAETMVQAFCVPTHTKGYRYMIEAIAIAARAENVPAVEIAKLYVQVAREYRTTSGHVERGIRHCIEIAWDRGGAQAMQSFFGDTVLPANGAFLLPLAAQVQEKMRGEAEC